LGRRTILVYQAARRQRLNSRCGTIQPFPSWLSPQPCLLPRSFKCT
jgi:hypothetical protein